MYSKDIQDPSIQPQASLVFHSIVLFLPLIITKVLQSLDACPPLGTVTGKLLSLPWTISIVLSICLSIYLSKHCVSGKPSSYSRLACFKAHYLIYLSMAMCGRFPKKVLLSYVLWIFKVMDLRSQEYSNCKEVLILEERDCTRKILKYFPFFTIFGEKTHTQTLVSHFPKVSYRQMFYLE